jgi:hypothetical protein
MSRRRQLSVTDSMAATRGPAFGLPIWIQFFRLSKSFDRRNYVHSRIMCSRPDSGWRAKLAKRGFAGLAHATWTKLVGTGRLSIIKASAGTLERGQLADTGTA